jgi:membrane-associated protease RseP (regulator of RpoE activity)
VTGWLIKEIAAGGAVDADGEEEQPQGTTSWWGLATIGALLALLLVQGGVWIFATAIAILICVFLHEVGHFVTARWAGMKVTQFFLGFGPRLWSFHRGEVEYGVRALPLGAFVRIIGMNNLDEVAPADEPRAFRSKSYWWRLLVMTAGSLMHFLIAIVLLLGVAVFYGNDEAIPPTFPLEAVVEDTPAERAGLRAGDTITSFDGTPIDDYDQLSTLILDRSPGDEVVVGYERDGRAGQVTAVLAARTLGEEQAAFLGVAPTVTHHEDLGPIAAVGAAGERFWDVSTASVRSLGNFISPSWWGEFFDHLSGETDDVSTRPSSVVGVARAGGDLGERAGWVGFLELVAIFNIFIGIFNLLPVLPFDGGHVVIATYEAIRSRKGKRYYADVTKMIPVAMTVVVLLSVLFLGSLYLDVFDPIGE